MSLSVALYLPSLCSMNKISFIDSKLQKDYLMIMLMKILPTFFSFCTLCIPMVCLTPLDASSKRVGNYFQSLDLVEEAINEETDPERYEDMMLVAEQQKRRRMSLSRTDQIPEGRLQEETVSYMEGYIQALIDANYYELNVLVYVDPDRVVYLYNLPKDDRIKSSIIAFVQDLPDVYAVREGKMDDAIRKKVEERQGTIRRINGVWFPESTVLFPPLIANPRDPIYSISYRWFDRVLARSLIAVSLGDTFPIFRWFDVFPAHGDLQIDIAAGVWADFNMNPDNTPNDEWAELITTDWLLAIPISYAAGRWAFRLRPYHISSHLGDEFIVNNSTIQRKNPSFEAIDLILSYQWREGIRFYIGPGVIVHSDKSYPMDWFYAEGGFEWRFPGLRFHYHRLYGAPFLAADVQAWQVNYFRPSFTSQLGYEFSKLQGAGRKVRLFVEYHNGYSAGQFFKENTEYLAIRASWGF